MPSQIQQSDANLVREANFRYHFADAVGLNFGDNGAKLMFAVEDPGDPSRVVEQFMVAMPPSTAKYLWFLLDQTIKNYEGRTGNEIPLDPAKVEGVVEFFKSVNARAQGG